MSSEQYRERLRAQQGPASLNPSFRPAVPRRHRDPVQAIDDMIPAPPGVDPTPDADEPVTPALPPHNPAQTGLLSHFNETLANAGADPAGLAPPTNPDLPTPISTSFTKLPEGNQLFPPTPPAPPATQPANSSATAEEDNDTVEDPTEALSEGSGSLGKPQ